MDFLKRHPAILLFAVFQVFFTAPGQTFLVSLFVPTMFADLGISLSLFAAIYSLATLLGALLLNLKGPILDHVSIQKVFVGSALLMAVGCLCVAFSSSMVLLFVGFLLLRFLGQGGFAISASTVLARNFERNRGKAMGILMLGYPLSEWVYPGIALILMESVGWRQTYLLFAASFIVLMIPIQLLLLKHSSIRPGKFLVGESMRDHDGPDPNQPQLRLRQALRQPAFMLSIVASCLPPVLLTGLFFHQATLFAYHDWPLHYAVTALSLYALSKAIFGVITGPMVDHFGPKWLFVAMIVLLGVGTVMAAVGGPPIIIFVYYSLMGIGIGLSGPVMNVVWPNLVGTQYLGSIKGFVATFRNGLTSLGPLPIALALDYGFSITWLLLVTGMVAIVMGVMPLLIAHIAPHMHRPDYA